MGLVKVIKKKKSIKTSKHCRPCLIYAVLKKEKKRKASPFGDWQRFLSVVMSPSSCFSSCATEGRRTAAIRMKANPRSVWSRWKTLKLLQTKKQIRRLVMLVGEVRMVHLVLLDSNVMASSFSLRSSLKIEQSLACCVQVLVPVWIRALEQCGGQSVVFQEERSSEMTAGCFFPVCWLEGKTQNECLFWPLCVFACARVRQRHSNRCLPCRLSNQRASGERGERYLNFPLRKLSHYLQFALIPLAWPSRPPNESILSPLLTFHWLVGTFGKKK